MEENKLINKKTVEQIIKNLLGEKALYVEKITNDNLNKIYKVITKNDNYIVRLSEEVGKINTFLKEQWCTSKARENGIPTPNILEVGNNVVPFPYMVLQEIPGLSGNNYAANKLDIYYQMGMYAKKINSIETHGYGKVFDWSNNILSKNETWENYLDRELNINQIFDMYEEHGILTSSNLGKLKTSFNNIRKWKFAPTLAHGEYLLKNIILSKSGDILSIINWESAMSFNAIYWESTKSMHDIHNDKEREKFIEGYGISKSEFDVVMKDVDMINVVRSAGRLKNALKERLTDEILKMQIELNKVLDKY